MWSLQHAVEMDAPPATVWAWYEATDLAPSWDPLVAEIRPDGPLALGQTGRNKPPLGPSVPFECTEMTREVSYTEVSRLPGAQMAFTHRLDARGASTLVTHGVECTGPLAWLYQLLVGRSYRRGLPQALENLARRAAAGPPA